MCSARLWRGPGTALILCWLLGACSNVTPDGAPPSVAKNAIDHPAGQKIFFEGDEGRHVVSLFDDGSYLFKTGDSSGLVIATRNGAWGWKRAGSHEARLLLDDDEWTLTFVSPNNAMAVNQAAPGRTYIFNFEPMGGLARDPAWGLP